MGVSVSFKKMAYIQVVLGIVAYAVAEGNPVLVLAGGTLATLSWYIVEGPGGRPLPEWLLNLGVIAATGWLFYSQLPGSNQVLIYSLGQFLIFMQLFKLYERKGNRDWAQLMVLSLMQMICAMLVGASFLFGILIAIYMGITLFTVLVFQLKVGHDEVNLVNEKQAPPGYKTSPVPAISSRHFTRHFNGLAVVSGLGCLLVSAVGFLAMPRGEASGILGDLANISKRQKTGISGEGMKLGSSGRIELSATPILNLRVTVNGKPVSAGAYEGTLLRQLVMDKYNPGKLSWDRSAEVVRGDVVINPVEKGAQDTPAAQEAPDTGGEKFTELMVGPPGLADEPVVRQHITLRGSVKGQLFSMSPQVRIDEREIGVSYNPYDRVLTSRKPTDGDSRGVYIVESFGREPPGLTAAYLRRWNPQGLAPFNWSDYARGPVVKDIRVTTVARFILAGSGLERDPAAQSTFHDHALADAIVQHLQKGEYAYTIDLPDVGTMDPNVAFLTDTRRGHCELFASGMCVLARELGLRARTVRGARVSEYNRVGGYYVVRERNMHAWVEVWQDGTGWKVYDPSPPAEVARVQGAGGGVFAFFRNLYEYAEFKWVDKVITYGSSERRSVIRNFETNLESVTAMLAKLKEQIDAVLQMIQRRFLNDAFGFVVFLTAGGVVLLTLVVSLMVMIKRRRAIQQLQLASVSRRLQRRLAKHLEFYLQMLRVLEKEGFIKPIWQTPASFAAQLELQNAVRFAPVVPLTDLFYEIRFGGRPLDSDRSRTIGGLLETLKQTL